MLDLPAEDGVRVLALTLLTDARAAARPLAGGDGEESLHDFRVALRRLRTALRSFRPWLAGSVRRKDERRLRRIARATGGARDVEVQRAWLAAQGHGTSAAQRAGHAFAVARLDARAAAAPDAGRAAARFLRAAAALRRRLARYRRRVDPSRATPSPFAAVLAARIAEETDAVSRRMAAIRGVDDERRVHRARIEAKRLRYLLEPLRDHPTAASAGAVARLRRLQDLLGDLHDAHLLEAALREAIAEAEAARDLRARAGLLALARRATARRDALHRDVERERRAHALDALAADASAVAATLARAASAGVGPRRARRRRPGA